MTLDVTPQSVSLESYIDAFEPITSRVRKDVTAIKSQGRSYWTKQSLTKQRLLAHLSGGLPRGVCPIKEGESVTRLALLDLDSHKGETSWEEMLVAAKNVVEALAGRNLSPIPFRSSGGNGIHIYIVWDLPQDAYSVRKYLSHILSKHGYENGVGGIDKGKLEIFPKQNSIEIGGYGNQFILPLAEKSRPLNLEDNLRVMEKECFLEIEWKCSEAVPRHEKPIHKVREFNNFDSDDQKLKDIADMLNYIEAEERDVWLKVGMAIHYETGDSDLGKEVWHEWSTSASTYKDAEDIDKTWDSFKNGKNELARIGTIRYLAAKGGWCKDVSDKFEILGSHEDVEKATRRFELIPAHIFAKQTSVRWLIKGVLPQVGLSMIFGQSGSGKTFFVLDLCLALARGENWRGYKVKNKSKVVYIAAEGVAGIRNRLKAYSMYFDTELRTVPFFVIQDSPNLHMDEDKYLIEEIQKQGGADILVLDTLAQVTPGANENSGEDMGAFLKRCQNLIHKLDCHVCIIHHSGKNQDRGSRGWSGMKGALDTEMEIKKEGAKNYGMLTKQKDGESGSIFDFYLDSFYIGDDEDGEPITSCIVKHTKRPISDAAEPKGKWQKYVISVFEDLEFAYEDGSIPEQDIIDRVKALEPIKGDRDRREEAIKRAIKELAKKELVEKVGNNLKFPQAHNFPQNGECGNLNHFIKLPQIPHNPMGVRNCGMELGGDLV